jgi:hypothetical protein
VLNGADAGNYTPACRAGLAAKITHGAPLVGSF